MVFALTPCQTVLLSLVLSVGQQQPNFSVVRFGNDIWLPQRTFSFGGFLGQDMAAVWFPVNKLPGAGFFKPFGSRTIGFNFRHGSSPSPAGFNMYGANHFNPAIILFSFRIIKYRWRELSKTGSRHRPLSDSKLRLEEISITAGGGWPLLRRASRRRDFESTSN